MLRSRPMAGGLVASAVLFSNALVTARASQDYSVTASNDDGSPGTLRWAIQQAEKDGTDSTITINVASISLASNLPGINAGRLVITGKACLIKANGTSGLQISSSQVTVQDLILDGAQYGVQLQNASSCVLSHVTVRNGSSNGAGLSLAASSDNVVKDCLFDDCPSQGILLQGGSSRNTIGPGNLIRNNDSGIVLYKNASDNNVFGAEIVNCNSVTISVTDGSTRNVVGPGNNLHDNSGTCILVDAPSNQLTGSTIKNCSSFGIYVGSQGSGTLIDGNSIDGCGSGGVYTKGASGVIVQHNEVLSCKGFFGVALESSPNATIGPDNAIALCDEGGVSLRDSDPCVVKQNGAIVLNFGPGLVVSSTKPRNQQGEILVESNAFILNPTGVSLSWGCQNVRVRSNRFTANIAQGVEILGDVQNEATWLGHNVEGNLFQGNGYTGISTYFASGVAMTCNLMDGAQGPGIDMQSGGVADQIKWNIIRNNAVGIALVLSHDTVVEGNYLDANDTGVHYEADDNTLRNNVIRGSRLAGLSGFSANSAMVFVNNTVVDNGVGLSGSGTGFNNIFFYNDYTDLAYVPGLSVDYCDIGGFLGGNPKSKSNFSLQPSFRDRGQGDFHLLDGSPCRNKGLNGAPRLPSTDFDASPFTPGDPRILEGVIDVGADEFSSSYVMGDRGGWAGFAIAHMRGFSPSQIPGSKGGFDLLRRFRDDGHSDAWGGPHIYDVTNLNDTGPGSLREAMLMANRDQGPSTINFAASLRGTIWLTYNLPNLADVFGGTDLEGTLESDGVTPKIKIACASNLFCSVFTIRTAHNIVRNLEVDVSVDALQLYGLARQNLLENVRIRNTQGGLGFGIVGADDNVFRRCVASNNLLPGYIIEFGAERNVLEDCRSESHATAPGVAFISAGDNTLLGTRPGASVFSGNASGIVVLGGSQNNTIGPNVTVSQNGWSVPAGVGVSLQGALTDGNVVTNVDVDDTNGPGIQVGTFASDNQIVSCTITKSAGSAVSLSSAPSTLVQNSTLIGRSGRADMVLGCFGWSPSLRIEANHVTGAGSAHGIYLEQASQAAVIANQVDGTFAQWGAGIALWEQCDGAVVQANVVGTTQGSSPDTGIYVRDAVSSVVMQNIVHVGNSNGQAHDTGILVGELGNFSVIGPDNVVDGVVATGDATGIALNGNDLGPSGVRIAQNRIAGNGLFATGLSALNLGDDLVVDSNDVTGCADFAMLVGPIASMRIVNNTIHANPNAVGIQLPWDSGGNQPQVMFNTVVCSDVPISGDGRVWFNIFWNNDSLASFNKNRADVHCNDVQGRASLGLPTDNAEIDPQFVNSSCASGDYHLSSSSPVIDYKCNAGKAPPSRPNHDMDSDARPKKADYDLGKDERP
ncbi:MAG: right-handed parallel beta-helix repeat-containing protein [Planctomycetota bacterium]